MHTPSPAKHFPMKGSHALDAVSFNNMADRARPPDSSLNFTLWKGARRCCILSPCLFNLYAEYIMRNAGLEEAQAEIKIAGRNINNLRYAENTTLMAESEEELKAS